MINVVNLYIDRNLGLNGIVGWIIFEDIIVFMKFMNFFVVLINLNFFLEYFGIMVSLCVLLVVYNNILFILVFFVGFNIEVL